MMKQNIYCLFLAFHIVFFAYSQDRCIELHRNAIRPGDKIIKQKMSYTPPGVSGENVQWDFSHVNTVDDYYPLIYFRYDRSDTTRMAGLEHGTRYCFIQTAEGIQHTGYDNHSVSMTFQIPETQLIFPLNYGDTLSAPFDGKGYIHNDMTLTASGRTFLHADGWGTLITPLNDTLKNVLRIKRTRTYDDIGVTNATMRLENYFWYAFGYRYPVFETVRSLAIIDGEEKEDLTTAFYYPPAWMETLSSDPANDTIRNRNNPDAELLISCQIVPNPVKTLMSVHLELSEPAQISLRLCTPLGQLLTALPRQSLAAGQHVVPFPASGLTNGYYLLYVQANQYVKTLVVIKK
jgi:hypothetical protein